MTLRCWLFFAIFLTMIGMQSVSAGTIDLSNETARVVHTGDTLVFHLFTWNFAKNAARFDLPLYPADFSFALVTAPAGETGAFSATLQSADKTLSVDFGDLQFSSGTFNSSAYSGAVSTLQGYLHLSPLLSASIFEAGSIAIALQNKGADIELGLSPYLLRQDLFASLSVGNLSVGALPGAVEIETEQKQLRLISYEGEVVPAAVADVPEPRSTALFLAGAAIFSLFSALLRPFSHRNVRMRSSLKISRLHPVIHSDTI